MDFYLREFVCTTFVDGTIHFLLVKLSHRFFNWYFMRTKPFKFIHRKKNLLDSAKSLIKIHSTWQHEQNMKAQRKSNSNTFTICSMNSAIMNKLKAKLQTEMLVDFIEWFANKYSVFFGLLHTQAFQIHNPKHSPYIIHVQHVYSLYQLKTQMGNWKFLQNCHFDRMRNA